MAELLLVLAAVGLVSALGLVVPLVPPEWLVEAGFWVTGAGLLLGLPTSLWWHLLLRARLLRGGRLPARWWLRPVSLHASLAPAERPAVLLWFYLGGIGFVLACAGCLLIGSGVVAAAVHAGVL
jgi:hypothetical protein